jgi:hypothetical protein
MKRKFLGILSIVLALVLLGSCAGQGIRLLLGGLGGFSPASGAAFREPAYVDYNVCRMYYASFPPVLRQAYRTVYNGFVNHDEKILLPKLTETALSQVLEAVRLENPQILCAGTEYSYCQTGAGTVLFPVYTVSAAGAEAMARALIEKGRQIVSAAPEGDAEARELYLHDAICALSDYGDGAYAQTAYGALISGTAVCAGYTAAAKLLFDLAGQPSAVVSGTAKEGEHQIPHAWNAVALYGEWVYLDVTWDDPVGGGERHDYFNLTERELAETHFGFVLPGNIKK